MWHCEYFPDPLYVVPLKLDDVFGKDVQNLDWSLQTSLSLKWIVNKKISVSLLKCPSAKANLVTYFFYLSTAKYSL